MSASHLTHYSDPELDSLIARTTARLERHAANLEAALDERERRGGAAQVALTDPAFAWMAAGGQVLH